MKKLIFLLILQSALYAQAAINLEFAEDCLINTGSRLGEFEIGGLSALQYHEKSKSLVALSDLKWDTDAHLFLFRLPMKKNLCPVPYRAENLEEKTDKNEIIKIESDGEGLAFDTDGTFFVSSEWGPPEDRMQTMPGLMAFSNVAQLTKKFSVPKAFYPIEYKFPPGTEPTYTPVKMKAPELKLPEAPKYEYNSNRLKRIFPDLLESLYEKVLITLWEMKVYQLKEAHREMVTNLEIETLKKNEELLKKYNVIHKKWEEDHITKSSGMQHNSGFEALSFDKSARILTVINELALVQDLERNPDIVRILRMRLDQSKSITQSLEHLYELDSGMRVSEILDLGNGRLLVLEIRFDTLVSKVFAKIFEAQIDDSKGHKSEVFLNGSLKPVAKKLVLDLNSIEDKLKSEYPRLDNLEGMALGPKLPKGEQSLILVSDNNRGENQKTQFLIFKMTDK